MKTTKKTSCALILLLVLVIASCKKSFLDKQPHDSVPMNNAILTESDLAAAINGVYASMRVSDLFGRTIPLMGDLLADNVYISQLNSGRYTEFNNYSIISNDNYIYQTWADAYNTILRANNAINSTVPADSNVNQLMGEAYTLRALMYFELVTIYAKPYSSANAGSPGVPLVLKFDPSARPKRNTIAEVYTQITSDLTRAVELLNTQKNSEYISKWSALGLQAKVYQYMGDWANAKTAALNVINYSGYSLADSSAYVAYWQNAGPTTRSETLFEISIDALSSNYHESLSAIYDQNDYGDALCDSTFYTLFSPYDVRSQLVYPGTRGGLPVFVANKYQNLLNTADQDDAKVLRLSEVYLLLAEAYYNLGDNASALLYLNTIAQIRQPSFVGYASSGAALINDITNERRKELAFEGNRFFDMNRLGLDINRGSDFPAVALLIPVSDPRRVMPIPRNETNANPNMVQNTGY